MIEEDVIDQIYNLDLQEENRLSSFNQTYKYDSNNHNPYSNPN